jgi:hypothetical protein
MPDAEWIEYRLFCPACDDYFTQLVALHQLPRNFDIDSHLTGMVERHNHKAYQEARAQKEKSSVDGQVPYPPDAEKPS